MSLAQPSNMIPYQYAKELGTKPLRCEDLYGKYALREIIDEGLDA